MEVSVGAAVAALFIFGVSEKNLANDVIRLLKPGKGVLIISWVGYF